MTVPGTLIISEYVEGTGNNKALEIANVGDTAVSTSDCIINRYQNGTPTAAASPIILDTTSLGPNQVVVICNNSFSQAGLCDQLSANLQHSGNDVVELQCGGVAKDIIGRIGEDAVWGTAPATTEDATLRRNCDVVLGDAVGGDPFEPSTQWTGFPVDTLSDLGQRNCP
jgi:predicted extracellular nuclease